MGTSHLILGALTDVVTGKTLPDTHDERILQRIARFLLEEKGFFREDILPRQKLNLTVDGKTGVVTVHFILCPGSLCAAAILYGPGSVVTRQRPALAAARLIGPAIPLVCVITNGEAAIVMETVSGKTIGQGLAALPSREEALLLFQNTKPQALSPERREKEERILFAMEVLTAKECADFTCRLP